ncbi:hypothetical protein GEOBC_02136 [Geobacteraceae bacterium]|nr:hypothetical protein GEOBC_02136 [Geobacteraceae bacterium]
MTTSKFESVLFGLILYGMMSLVVSGISAAVASSKRLLWKRRLHHDRHVRFSNLVAQAALHRHSGARASADGGASDHCRRQPALSSARPSAAQAPAAARTAARHAGRTLRAAMARSEARWGWPSKRNASAAKVYQTKFCEPISRNDIRWLLMFILST